ncbi:hypothetical protein BGZ83_000142 [Gryganskiella cystojenkinii]|nr:hypothetical protein BGZ83_000142 [Gryganskiella cystojenkinii]
MEGVKADDNVEFCRLDDVDAVEEVDPEGRISGLPSPLATKLTPKLDEDEIGLPPVSDPEADPLPGATLLDPFCNRLPVAEPAKDRFNPVPVAVVAAGATVLPPPKALLANEVDDFAAAAAAAAAALFSDRRLK